MRRNIAYIGSVALAVLVSACLTGCVNEQLASGDEEWVKPSDTDTYITFNLDLSDGDTRAVTSEGQDGDEFEYGSDNEERIDDITFFLFRINSWDAQDNAPCLYKGHLDPSNCVEWKGTGKDVSMTFRLKGYTPGTDDRVIVVANGGDRFDNLSTLGQVRLMAGYEAWRKGTTLAECDKFVITSAYNDSDNGKIEFAGKAGTKADPYISGVRVQRVAARIDFMYDPARNVTGSAPYNSFDYQVNKVPGDESTELLARLHIVNIIPYNVKQTSSFLIRQVTAQGDIYGTGGVLYGGHEYKDDKGIPANYVLEPHTLSKGLQDDLVAWYGDTRASAVFGNPAGYLTGTAISDYSRDVREESGDIFVTVAYANENTQTQAHYSERYVTGILLRAIYVPLRVYSDAAATVASAVDFSAGHTFWRFVPSFSSQTESECVYFDNAAAANAYKASVAGGGEVACYPDGVCYYKVWIRHASVARTLNVTYPMEYAIVRNNVYRVSVDCVTGPGTPSPDEPDTDNATTRIYVRKWNCRTQPTIRL